jgi:RNA polymerase sigma factor (TIGR02999 family)
MWAAMPASDVANTIAGFMAAFRKGDQAAAGKLVEALYPELRRLAAVKMKGERNEHTWQPTALVNELYLELVKIKALKPPTHANAEERAAFFGLAGHLMKRLLIHHARPLYRRMEKVEIGNDLGEKRSGALDEVEQALSRLAAIDPRLRTVVEMKVFEGLTGDEIAHQIGCAPATVARYWSFARRWLREELAGAESR